MPTTKKIELDKLGFTFERSPLDPTLLALEEEELSFFTEQTGITDNEKLREHILQIQAEAYAQFPYPCIHRFTFTKLTIARLPEYDHVIKVGRREEGAIFLDVGCCLGNDVRTIIASGFPKHKVVAMDLDQGFWDLGHKLFNSSPRTLPIPFIQGDIFDTEILDPSPPVYTAPPTAPPPLLHLGNSLNGLRYHVSVIHASAFFHLFSEDQQLQVARNLATLLSPVQGSIILGTHIGQSSPGIKFGSLSGDREMFCHSPESWRTMWDGVVFRKESVEVRVVLSDIIDTPMTATDEALNDQGPSNNERWRNIQWLRWSVVRV